MNDSKKNCIVSFHNNKNSIYLTFNADLRKIFRAGYYRFDANQSKKAFGITRTTKYDINNIHVSGGEVKNKGIINKFTKIFPQVKPHKNQCVRVIARPKNVKLNRIIFRLKDSCITLSGSTDPINPKTGKVIK